MQHTRAPFTNLCETSEISHLLQTVAFKSDSTLVASRKSQDATLVATTNQKNQ